MYIIVAVLILTLSVDLSTCQARLLVERLESKEGLSKVEALNRANLNCSKKGIDAAVTVNGTSYFFKDDFYWPANATKSSSLGYPRLISHDWNHLPGNLDAAFTWADGRTFFFKGSNYWSFHGKKMDYGNPRRISQGFPGVPDNIDAAVFIENANFVYFLKGSVYWRFSSGDDCVPISSDYPMNIGGFWPGVPNDVDAILTHDNGWFTVFKGDMYYLYEIKAYRTIASAVGNNWGLTCEELKCRIF